MLLKVRLCSSFVMMDGSRLQMAQSCSVSPPAVAENRILPICFISTRIFALVGGPAGMPGSRLKTSASLVGLSPPDIKLVNEARLEDAKAASSNTMIKVNGKNRLMS